MWEDRMPESCLQATPVGPLLQGFFSDHLLSRRRASPQTVASYGDTFFLHRTAGKEPSSLRISDLDAPVVLAFLDHLERDRGNGIRSRNARLAAIRSFFRSVSLRDPSSLPVVTRILAIPVKRDDKRLVGYLTKTEIEAILTVPDQKQWSGQRDYTLFLTLYNTGARISEIVSLRRQQIRFGESTFVELNGKGRKQRSVPLWSRTARCLKSWLEANPAGPDAIVFPNSRGGSLSRDGAAYILQKTVQQARATCSTLSAKTVTPHVLRHTTAMHLLQSGVDIAVIALWLGHESIETTHVYVEADLETKEQALRKVAPVGKGFRRFQPADKLLAFLESL
jgi:integrase/recombinase XerD